MKIENRKKKEIEEKLSEFISKYKVNAGSKNIIETAQKAGFIVAMLPLHEDTDGLLFINSQADKILDFKTKRLIVINQDKSVERKIFTIAHEIGHFALHYNKNIPMFAHRDSTRGKDATENEADYFAANLLMPKKEFKEKYVALRNNFDEEETIRMLAVYYRLEEEGVARRIEEVEKDKDV